MKILAISAIITFVSISSLGQTTQPVKLVNKSNCTLHYTVLCTTNDCTDVTGGTSSTLGSNSDVDVSCSTGDFAGLRFIYPNGDDVVRYITFNNELANQCEGLEGCNALYPSLLQGVESGCLGINGEIRADYFSDYDQCVIYFKIGF